MKALIDNREGHLAEFLEGTCEELVFTQLPVGDYLVVSDSGARAQE
jgi:ERCC4-type nuclease